MKRIICFLLAVIMLLSFTGCKRQNEELTAEIENIETSGNDNDYPMTTEKDNDKKGGQTSPSQNDGEKEEEQSQNDGDDGTVEISDEYISEEMEQPFVLEADRNKKVDVTTIDLSFKLFSKVAGQNEGKNILMSPLSVSTALAMSANGAKGNTLKEIETLLGCKASVFNTNSKKFFNNKGAQLKDANSIWLRENGVEVNKTYMDTLKDVYKAEVKSVPMTDATVKEVNNWVENKTDGMIKEIIKEINPQTVSILINALSFDAKWKNAYRPKNIRESVFYGKDGKQKVEFMFSKESFYLEDEMVTGFIRPYKDDKYSFVGLLPKGDLTAELVAKEMTADQYKALIESSSNEKVNVGIPSFKSDYELDLVQTLKALGVQSAFDVAKADFSAMGKASDGNIYIGKVIHKATITVDPNGTKAAAATVIEGLVGGIDLTKSVCLLKPFVYMIIDNETNTPIFMGVVNNIN